MKYFQPIVRSNLCNQKDVTYAFEQHTLYNLQTKKLLECSEVSPTGVARINHHRYDKVLITGTLIRKGQRLGSTLLNKGLEKVVPQYNYYMYI